MSDLSIDNLFVDQKVLLQGSTSNSCTAAAMTSDENLWLSEKLAVEVLKQEGAIITDGWLCWEIPWAADNWVAVTESTSSALQVSEAHPEIMAAGAATASTEEPPAKKKAKKKKKGEVGFGLSYWPEKGVNQTMAHFQWNYGHWGCTMGWGAFNGIMQTMLMKASSDGTSEIEHGDREQIR